MKNPRPNPKKAASHIASNKYAAICPLVLPTETNKYKTSKISFVPGICFATTPWYSPTTNPNPRAAMSSLTSKEVKYYLIIALIRVSLGLI